MQALDGVARIGSEHDRRVVRIVSLGLEIWCLVLLLMGQLPGPAGPPALRYPGAVALTDTRGAPLPGRAHARLL